MVLVGLREALAREVREPSAAFWEIWLQGSQELGVPVALEILVRRLPQEGAEAPRAAQGLMVVRAILMLAPLLAERDFRVLLAVQARWLAGQDRQEDLSGAVPASCAALSYTALRQAAAPDMASTGLKAILAHQMEDLARRAGLGDELLPLVHGVAGSLPGDFHWHRLALKRLEGPVPEAAPGDPLKVLCEGSQKAVLDTFGALVRRGIPVLDLLVEGAARKLLEADRGLQGRTAWIFPYLATLQDTEPACALQASALVNLFPSETWAERDSARRAACRPEALGEAILDGDAGAALRIAHTLLSTLAPGALLPAMAGAAAASDPMNDAGHRLLALAALAELMPRLSLEAGSWACLAMAAYLGATQGGGDLVAAVGAAWETA